MGKNTEQIDIFSSEIYRNLIPKDHLLVKINDTADFSFVYDLLKDKYSSFGRESKDPAMMVKILLLEYLYFLSDVEIAKRIQTDVAFRWFLGLSIYDPTPDDTTISHFRVNRLDSENLEQIFNEIVKLCIELDLVKTRRYLPDTTDVAANANFPFLKQLVRDAYRKVMKEVEKFDEYLAKEFWEQTEEEIDYEYKQDEEKVASKKHCEITLKYLEKLYLKTYEELQHNTKYIEAYTVCYDIIDQHMNNKGDKIISVVDPDARSAHKSKGNVKMGYKNHILVDEDSEIIVSSVQTPFNVNDEKKLEELIKKAETDLCLKPEEITADKAYGTTENRAYLKDNGIISNIDFYKERTKKNATYGINDFEIAEDVSYVICPNNIATTEFKPYTDKDGKEYKHFKFARKHCDVCELNKECLRRNKDGKFLVRSKVLRVGKRYDAVLRDKKRVQTEEFKEAKNKRFKVERRFATMVTNHGLRLCRYTRLEGAKKHIILTNIVTNVVRMVNLIFLPKESVPKNKFKIKYAN